MRLTARSTPVAVKHRAMNHLTDKKKFSAEGSPIITLYYPTQNSWFSIQTYKCHDTDMPHTNYDETC
jgi:hypothetical protein